MTKERFYIYLQIIKHYAIMICEAMGSVCRGSLGLSLCSLVSIAHSRHLPLLVSTTKVSRL